MQFIQTLLENNLLLTLFLTIFLGYVAGKVNILGFSLGSGAVLFVGLAIGAFAPKSSPPTILGTLGLLMFLYGVGIQYGKEFFKGMTSLAGLKANFAALVGVLCAGAISILLISIAGVDKQQALGLFAGSATSTSTLQAVLESFKTDKATIGYSIAYPFGVAGPMLCIYLLKIWLKPKIQIPELQRVDTKSILLRDESFFNQPFSKILAKLPQKVSIVAIRRDDHNQIPNQDFIMQKNDVLLITTTDKILLAKTEEILGISTINTIVTDRRALDYIRVFISKHFIAGKTISNLILPEYIQYSISHIRRGEIDLMPNDNLVLEIGDRVGILVDRKYIKEVRAFFGDSTSSLADFSYIAIGLGASLGLLIGIIPVPIPGLGNFTLGLAGLLLFSLYLGKKGRTGPIVWEMPLPSNIVIRQFGLTIFLAQVGLSSGGKFIDTISMYGFSSLIYGAIILLSIVFVTTILCLWVFKLPFDLAMGIVAGATGNPAISAFTSKIIPTEKPDIGYAMIFPSMTVVKILFVKIAAIFLGN